MGALFFVTIFNFVEHHAIHFPRFFVRGLFACMIQVDGELPSTEAWESLKGFLLGKDRGTDAAKPDVSSNIRRVAAGVILSRLRTPSSISSATAASVTDTNTVQAAQASPAGIHKGRVLLRVIAVDYIVSLIRLEATAPVVIHTEHHTETGGATRGWSASGSSYSGAAAPVGVESVWQLLNALTKPSEDGDDVPAILSVLGSPALADAVLDAEFAAGGSGGRGTEVSEDSEGGIDSSVRNRFPLTSAAVESLRDLSRRSCRPVPLRLPDSAQIIPAACASGLVSFATAAFRRCSSYREGDGASSGDARGKALSTLAKHAADCALRSPPALRLFSGEGAFQGSASCDTGREDGYNDLEMRVIIPQLRALATVHSWPRQRIVLDVAQRLSALSPGSSLAVDLAVLASHVVGAGVDASGVSAIKNRGGATINTVSVERMLLDMLLSRRFSAENPKVMLMIASAAQCSECLYCIMYRKGSSVRCWCVVTMFQSRSVCLSSFIYSLSRSAWSVCGFVRGDCRLSCPG